MRLYNKRPPNKHNQLEKLQSNLRSSRPSLREKPHSNWTLSKLNLLEKLHSTWQTSKHTPRDKVREHSTDKTAINKQDKLSLQTRTCPHR